MPRVNVYLPDELAESVRQLDISVSPVCQRALEQEVRKVQAAKEASSDLEHVAARLRGDQQRDAKAQYTDGFEAGTRWAKDHATLTELEDIIRWRHDPGWTRLDIPEDTHSLAWFLGRQWGEDPGGSSLTYRLERGDPFIQGVLEGAAEVYRKVMPLL